jgi:hypothetical protein
MRPTNQPTPIRLVVAAVVATVVVSLVAATPASARSQANDLVQLHSGERHDSDGDDANDDGIDLYRIDQHKINEDRTDQDDRWFPEPLGPSQQLTTGPFANGGFNNTCFIDFDDDVIISTLPGQAANSFVTWPFWTQVCGYDGVGIAVEPIGYWHYHLNYVDPPVWCGDIGAFGHIDDDGVCHPIDPVTEPRSGIQPHSENFGIRIYAYDIDTKERVKFDLNQIRILGGDSEVCFQRTDYPWIAAEPTDDPAGYCGTVEPGSWDVSATVTDAYEVRVWSRSPLMSMTDLGITV